MSGALHPSDRHAAHSGRVPAGASSAAAEQLHVAEGEQFQRDGTARPFYPIRSDSRAFVVDLVLVAGGTAVAFALLGSTVSWLAAAAAALWWIPVVIVVRTDLERYIIPDLATAAIAGLGLAYVGVAAAAEALDAADVGWPLAMAAATAAAAFAVFWLIGEGFRAWSGRDGLGFGDVKLAAASALWLGPGDAVVALEIAALGALGLALARRRGTPVREAAIPFGAFLAPAAWLVFVAEPAVQMLIDR